MCDSIAGGAESETLPCPYVAAWGYLPCSSWNNSFRLEYYIRCCNPTGVLTKEETNGLLYLSKVIQDPCPASLGRGIIGIAWLDRLDIFYFNRQQRQTESDA